MKLVSVDEAAPALGYSRQALYRVIRENKFPVPAAMFRIGKQVRINLQLVEEAMRAGISAPSQSK